jgi:hypothetical protein
MLSSGDRYDMTRTGLREDTTLGAIRLDWWAASDWNGARNTFGIPGRASSESAPKTFSSSYSPESGAGPMFAERHAIKLLPWVAAGIDLDQ